MKKSKKVIRGEAVFLLIAGLIMGTVFTIGMQHWNTPITQDEAQHVTATFSSYEKSLRRGRVQEIILRFDDYEQLHIDGVCVDNELADAISEIESGSIAEMMVHPNSNTILEMKVGTMKLLQFQDSIQKLSLEASEFMYFGIFCYIMAIVGFIYLVLPKKR